MSKILSILIVLAVTVFAKDVKFNTASHKFAIHPPSRLKFQLLQVLKNHPNQFVLSKVPRSEDDAIEVEVSSFKAVEDLKNSLQKSEIQFEITKNEVHQPKEVQPSILKNFPRYKEIQLYLFDLATEYPDITKLFRVGKSSEGRDIIMIRISSGGDGTKPALFIDAGIHAREWMAPATALYAIKQLVENPSNHYVFEDIDIYIVPLLNPDGYEYTHVNPMDIYNYRLWRKTRSHQRYGCTGVDPNRNFGFKWNVSGTSSDPCSDTYGGSHPFSEPETRALRDTLLELKDRVKVYLSLHSFSQAILYPWGYAKEVSINEPTLKCVAQKAADELSKVRGTQYKVGSTANILSAAAGGSDDWAMAVAGIELAYTIELPPTMTLPYVRNKGYYGFSPPPSLIEPVGRETFEAFKVFAQYVENKICHSV